MQWLDMERIYFGAYEIHAHYIPLGTFYRLKLVSTHGQKVSLGERIRGADDLAKEIAKFTLKPMMRRAMQSFENAQEIDFGAILVSRANGVTVCKCIPIKKFRGRRSKDTSTLMRTSSSTDLRSTLR
jgi:hypothetical protein